MTFARTSLIAALLGLALAPVAAGAEEQHHQPGAQAPSQPSAAMPAAPMMMPMMEMMGQGSMGMMGMMGQQPTPMMMGIADHLEGRIAFLRAELGITEAQAATWDRFAQALRDGAAKTKQPSASAQQTAGVLQRMEQEEQRLGARLEAVKAIRAAFAELQMALSDDQKRTTEALFTRPVCFGATGVL